MEKEITASELIKDIQWYGREPKRGRCRLCIKDRGEKAPVLSREALHAADNLLLCDYHFSQYQELTA